MNSVTVDSLYDHDPDEDLMARLPGEALDHSSPDQIPEQMLGHATESFVADERKGHRQASGKSVSRSNVPLYAGVGLVALLMVGGYVVLQSALSHHPVQTTQTAPVTAIAPNRGPITPLAPSAGLANVKLPPAPSAIINKKFVPEPAASELSELMSFHPGPPAAMPTALNSQTPLAAGETGGLQRPATHAPALLLAPAKLAPPGQAQSGPGGPLAAAKPVAVHYPPAGAAAGTISSASPTPTARPNPANAAINFTNPGNAAAPINAPAPASAGTVKPLGALAAPPSDASAPALPTSVYQLLTQIGVLVRDDEIKQAVLAAQIQQFDGVMSAKMADYDRRLSILEAQAAVSGAVQAASNTGVPAVISAAPAPLSGGLAALSASTPSAPPSVTPVTPAMRAASAPNSPVAAVQYQVQAASPGLAMLSPIGGNGSPLEVQTGNIIPGYGRVLGVVQQGDSWVVQTQNGNIQ